MNPVVLVTDAVAQWSGNHHAPLLLWGNHCGKRLMCGHVLYKKRGGGRERRQYQHCLDPNVCISQKYTNASLYFRNEALNPPQRQLGHAHEKEVVWWIKDLEVDEDGPKNASNTEEY